MKNLPEKLTEGRVLGDDEPALRRSRAVASTAYVSRRPRPRRGPLVREAFLKAHGRRQPLSRRAVRGAAEGVHPREEREGGRAGGGRSRRRRQGRAAARQALRRPVGDE